VLSIPRAAAPRQAATRWARHARDWLVINYAYGFRRLCCLCRYHHVLKDAPGWNFDFNGHTGTLTATTPTGRQHATQPEPLTEPINDTPPPF
jgi:hypothetical protein